MLLISGPKNQIVSSGDNVTLSCEFQSLLNTSVAWLFNGIQSNAGTVVTTRNRSTLYLQEVTTSQSGNYTCQLDNGISDPVESTGVLVIGRLVNILHFSYQHIFLIL